MKIESSDIYLASQHASLKQATVEESLRAWVGQQRPDFEGRSAENKVAPAQLTMVTISPAARHAATNTAAPANPKTAEANDAAEQEISDPKIRLMINLIESLTGKKVKLFNPNELNPAHSQKTVHHAAEAGQSSHAIPPAENQRNGWGVEYDRHETIHESEQTAFSAQGIIRTSDGKEIQFNISLEMKREFVRESNISIREGDGVRKDPLVINFNGTAAQLGDTKFSFDLNADGETEQISFVGAGSGFLALDKNDNGIIDNGSELFGTQSGNGFADLAAYDSDGNNWIDENDAVYSRLQVWSKDTSGQDTLSTLAQRNVGALYLGNVTTPFDLKNTANELQGQVRSSGIYLQEDGSAGTLQQIDLIV